MIFAAAFLALWFVPTSVLAGIMLARGASGANLLSGLAGALAGGALALWGFDAAVTWWRRRAPRRAGVAWRDG